VETSRPTILIVDDDHDLQASLMDFLSEEGFDVKEAAGGLEALALLRGGLRPSALVLDMMMPKMNGLSVIEELQGDPELARLPLLVLSASIHLVLPARVSFIPKPFDVDAFLVALRRLLDAPASTESSAG
jgi:CheY-like chemotaxis protein